MPAIPKMMCEETPQIPLVLVREQNPYFSILLIQALRAVVPPYDTEKQWSGACHHRNIGHDPTPVIILQLIDDPHEERMLWHRTHCVVADPRRYRLAYPCWIA